ncbi:MAG TPA: SpoIIE family protein phosphatase, partial [Bacteroidota bacterium]
MKKSPSKSPPDVRDEHDSRFELTALLEFSRVISSAVDFDFILGHLLLTVMGKVMCTRAVVALHQGGDSYRIQTAKGLPSDAAGREFVLKKVPKRLSILRIKAGSSDPWTSFLRRSGIVVVVPLNSQDRCLGLVGFGERFTKRGFTKEEITFLESLVNVAATAVEKGLFIEEVRRVNRVLDRKVQELNTLFELSKEFNAVIDEQSVTRLLTFALLGQVGGSRYFVGLKGDHGLRLVGSRLSPELEVIDEDVLSIQGPKLLRDLPKRDGKLRKRLEEAGIRALVPMQVQNETKGVIGLGGKVSGEEYTKADLEFLYSLGNLAIISLENARLFKEALEKQKMEDELLIAREIQKNLLPARLPDLQGFDMTAVNVSSKQVGGDYYDVIPLGDSRVILAIADVSGKGTPASLLMANLQASIRALVPTGLSLSELTGRVNDLLHGSTGPDKFITMFWGSLDLATRTLRYVNAGHNPPYLLRANGDLEKL